MPYNISDIKKLPVKERLEIIDELWNSIDDEWQQFDNEPESAEVIELLEERLAAYKKGNLKSYSWEEVEKLLKQRAKDRNK
jgi:putative addiction module component (TIGR02574 family)